VAVVSADAAYVVNNAGRQIKGSRISATEDGAVTLTTLSGQTMTFQKEQYRSAVADRPVALTKAEQLLESEQAEQAVPLLNQVKAECRFLAWDQTAIQLLADYYFRSGQYAKAGEEFQALEDQSDPETQRKLRAAMMKSGKTETVLAVLNEDIATGSREAAAQAYLMRGELKAANGDAEGACRDWLKVATFFKAQKELARQAEERLEPLIGID
jgi:tetratricopeptide (TPR) repeat protein